jgi:hypothetical protein
MKRRDRVWRIKTVVYNKITTMVAIIATAVPDAIPTEMKQLSSWHFICRFLSYKCFIPF